MTDASEIPLCTEGLKLLCVLPRGGSADTRLSVRAEIDIASPLDRWATAAQRGVAQAGLEARMAIGGSGPTPLGDHDLLKEIGLGVDHGAA